MQKIIHLIKDAQQQKAPAQQFTDRFGTYYTYSVLGLSLVMFFVWWLGFGQAPFASEHVAHSAFYHAMTLLVVASPCALVLSIPSAVLAAIAWGARHGILFRGGAAVEKLAAVNTVALDKTGTLTTGELRVETVESFPPGREAEVARLAFSLERLSTHPLARAITRHGKQQGLPPLELANFESITGQGLRARRNGESCLLGRREWLAEGPHASAIARVSPTEAGFSEIWLTEGSLLGRLILRDDIRPEARDLVEELHREGLRAVVLTGDRKATAEHLRTELRIQDVRAELKPEEKLDAIRALTQEGRVVAMVGDGVNDAPSLAAAHIGVAMGARGSDAALEQADVVLMHDRLENFLAAFRLSQRARLHYPSKPDHLPGNGRGAGYFCHPGPHPPHRRRCRPRRQHGDRRDEQPAPPLRRRPSQPNLPVAPSTNAFGGAPRQGVLSHSAATLQVPACCPGRAGGSCPNSHVSHILGRSQRGQWSNPSAACLAGPDSYLRVLVRYSNAVALSRESFPFCCLTPSPGIPRLS